MAVIRDQFAKDQQSPQAKIPGKQPLLRNWFIKQDVRIYESLWKVNSQNSTEAIDDWIHVVEQLNHSKRKQKTRSDLICEIAPLLKRGSEAEELIQHITDARKKYGRQSYAKQLASTYGCVLIPRIAKHVPDLASEMIRYLPKSVPDNLTKSLLAATQERQEYKQFIQAREQQLSQSWRYTKTFFISVFLGAVPWVAGKVNSKVNRGLEDELRVKRNGIAGTVEKWLCGIPVLCVVFRVIYDYSKKRRLHQTKFSKDKKDESGNKKENETNISPIDEAKTQQAEVLAENNQVKNEARKIDDKADAEDSEILEGKHNIPDQKINPRDTSLPTNNAQPEPSSPDDNSFQLFQGIIDSKILETPISQRSSTIVTPNKVTVDMESFNKFVFDRAEAMKITFLSKFLDIINLNSIAAKRWFDVFGGVPEDEAQFKDFCNCIGIKNSENELSKFNTWVKSYDLGEQLNKTYINAQQRRDFRARRKVRRPLKPFKDEKNLSPFESFGALDSSDDDLDNSLLSPIPTIYSPCSTPMSQHTNSALNAGISTKEARAKQEEQQSLKQMIARLKLNRSQAMHRVLRYCQEHAISIEVTPPRGKVTVDNKPQDQETTKEMQNKLDAKLAKIAECTSSEGSASIHPSVLASSKSNHDNRQSDQPSVDINALASSESSHAHQRSQSSFSISISILESSPENSVRNFETGADQLNEGPGLSALASSTGGNSEKSLSSSPKSSAACSPTNQKGFSDEEIDSENEGHPQSPTIFSLLQSDKTSSRLKIKPEENENQLNLSATVRLSHSGFSVLSSTKSSPRHISIHGDDTSSKKSNSKNKNKRKNKTKPEEKNTYSKF